MIDDPRGVGFKELVGLDDARERLLETLVPVERTETVPVADADGRTVATAVTTPRPVPHYDRVTADGVAVRAQDTFSASDRSPVALELAETVGPGEARRVDAGSELPVGADAIVRIERANTDDADDTAEVFEPVAAGENVAPVGADVTDGQQLFDTGHDLRPSDLALLRAAGVDTVDVIERPRVSVLPTGSELVQSDPDPGEVVETNAQMVRQYVGRWGGLATTRETVPDDETGLRDAIERDTDHDLVVTVGGSGVGEQDLLATVVDGLGEVLVHGVAIDPGHSVAVGVVEETTVLVLPGSPVSAVVAAVQLLRPALGRLAGRPMRKAPTTETRLDQKLAGEVGMRSFVGVRVDSASERDDAVRATPVRSNWSGALSTVALADGWVVVPEATEGYAAGRTVAVEHWEWSQ